MHYKELKKADIPQDILDTQIVNWKFRESVTFDHGKYCIRLTLTFQSGKTKNVQRGGFRSKKEALLAKDQILLQLNNHTYIPFLFTAQEFWDYYLCYYMIDEKHCSYNTFMSYKNVISYIYSVINPKTRMIDITREMLINVFLSYPSPWLRKQAYGVICGSFKVALQKNIIASNPSNSARDYVKKIKNEEDKLAQKKRNRSFSPKELNSILSKCKECDPDFYLFLLFSVSTGVRISEERALCFSDIDYINKTCTISRQLGRDFSNEGIENQLVTRQFIPLKTKNANRTIPLPDFLLDELILAKRRQEIEKQNDELYLKDADFIFTSCHGYPLSRGTEISIRFKRILSECGIDSSIYHWHDLRHTYATLLRHENPKALAIIMGHGSHDFTEKVYIDTSKDIRGVEEMKYMNQYIQQLIDETPLYYDLSSIQTVIDQLISRK